MPRKSRIFAIIISVLILLSFAMPKVAAVAASGRITGDGVNMRDKATTSGSNKLATLSKGTIVTINGKVTGQVAVSGGGNTWYNITYGGKTGYVYGKYVEEITPPAYNADFETNLLNFPESYREALRAIHNAYPNWIFVADKLNISLDDAIDLEYSEADMQKTRKWVELDYGLEWRDPRADENNPNHIKENRWIFASRKAIAFFMDPRNALTVTNSKGSYPSLFTFLEQSYNSATQNEAGLRSIITGTFLASGYGGDSDAYVKDIMAAAAESGVSPYVIATTIIIEQGTKGTSRLISGTYSGYEGYYNFFNYGAYGDNVIKNGLEYAKNQGWNSRRKAIVGGANKYASGYINAGQDTYYYMDFNVKYKDKIYHQYATALYDQCEKAVNLRKACTTNPNAALTFKIPVYTSLPIFVSEKPTLEDYYVHTCIGEVINAKPATCLEAGYTGDTVCSVCGEFISEGSVIPKAGHNESDWIIDIAAEPGKPGLWHKECTVCGEVLVEAQIPAPDESIPGDINGDTFVNNKDLTRLFQFLSEWDVSVNTSALDVNGDTFINNKDLTRLFQYLSEWDVVIY